MAGVALVLGGLGPRRRVSFQAFSYELKCAGREFCSFTNGFEVRYSLTQAWSVSAMLIAVAIACALGRGLTGCDRVRGAERVGLLRRAVPGVMQPSKFLLSFELLMLFAVPHHHRDRDGPTALPHDHDRAPRAILIAAVA